MQGSSNQCLDTPEILKMRLNFLLRRYVRGQAANTAQMIVLTLESLLTHPDYDAKYQECCCYRKLLLQWRVLSMAS